MRGENVAFLALLNLNHGTSPHVWGKLPNEPRGQVTTRNIPTCVGNTAASARVSPPRAEHPHMCGENGRTGAEGVSATGTSPHVWGKRNKARSEIITARNIPTCVGKTTTKTS